MAVLVRPRLKPQVSAFPLQGKVRMRLGRSIQQTRCGQLRAANTDSAIAHPTARHGKLRLGFERRADRTVLVEQYSHAPLRVMRPIGHASGAALVYVLSPTGGVLHGDEYDVSIQVGPDAHAVFTTQAATKVYGMTRQGATQATRIHVEAGGLLEYRPDPVILYANSDYTQSVDITLDDGARLVYHDVVVPGRAAHGERLAFRQFTTRLTVRGPDGVVAHERTSLQPDDAFDGVGALDGFTCWGSWYCLGIGDPADAAVAAAGERLSVGQDSAVGVTRLPGGLAARALAHTAQPIERAFGELADSVYPTALGVDRIDLRKY
jgi:urease accessory protein